MVWSKRDERIEIGKRLLRSAMEACPICWEPWEYYTVSQTERTYECKDSHSWSVAK